MEEFYYLVFEYFLSEKGEEKRLLWKFDNEEAALGLVHFIENNDFNWPIVKIEKVHKDGQITA